jgi:endonuclease/exonuclease/phosphatase family metal-dependent hydrolase
MVADSLGEEKSQTVGGRPIDMSDTPQNSQLLADHSSTGKNTKTQPRTTYQLCTVTGTWQPIPSYVPQPFILQLPSILTLSSYNILHDPSLEAPTEDRYPLLLASILSPSALADILVLQEVFDDFLSYLLGHERIRNHYSFTTHAPPDQEGIGPLRSFRNVVALSRWRFRWEWLPFDCRHKGAVILRFETVGECKDEAFYPLVIAGVHLTCGLTDGTVLAKKLQLQTLLGHLLRNYSESPWIIAGDFNIVTSKFTIEEAVKMKCISVRTVSHIAEMERMFSDSGLVDPWIIASPKMEGMERLMGGLEDVYEGEEGATFDPTINPLAAEMAKRNSNNIRPQSYDRILVKRKELLEVMGFNMFGFLERGSEAGDGGPEDQGVDSRYGSDHWGIRCTLRIGTNLREKHLDDIDIKLASRQLRKAPSSLSDDAALNICLMDYNMFPTDEEVHKRNEIFTTMKNVLQQNLNQGAGEIADDNQSNLPLVVVPVESYGLGVWSTSSDIDILCIGSTSSKVFFTLATQRLKRASYLGVRILRKVNAASGTMLELEMRSVKLDLQYCPLYVQVHFSIVFRGFRTVHRADLVTARQTNSLPIVISNPH